MLPRLKEEDPQFKTQRRLIIASSPWHSQPGPLLAALDAACLVELAAPPNRATGLIWTGAALTQQAGSPTVILHPKGDGNHALVEYGETHSVVASAHILPGTAIHYCG